MESPYGLIPLPKWNEEQSNYYTFVHDQYSIGGIPVSVQDPAMTSAVMEALAAESYRYVTPAYYDVVLNGKYLRDADSSEMLELAMAGVNVDMIVQAGASVGTADISFTVPEAAVKQVREILIERHDVLGYKSFDIDTNVGKVAVVGVGMKTHSGLAAKFFNALSEKGINVLIISTSEIRIAALVPLDQLNDAVKALHTAYGLDTDQVEAVVYGGTGR